MYRLHSRTWSMALLLVCAWYGVSSCFAPCLSVATAPDSGLPANAAESQLVWFDQMALPAEGVDGTLDLVHSDRTQPVAIFRLPADLSRAWLGAAADPAKRLAATPSLIVQHVRLQI